jgi:hypothetical protein
MQDPVQFLTRVLGPESQAGEPYSWEDLLTAVQQVSSAAPSPQVENLLSAALRFEGRLRLTPTSGRPHRLSPEDMVKSLAIQTLGRWGLAAHLPEIERIESTARSPGLASVARATAQRLRHLLEHNGTGESGPDAAQAPDSCDRGDDTPKAVSTEAAPISPSQMEGI